MQLNKANIFAQLKKDVLHLQGLMPPLAGESKDHLLGPMRFAFPNAHFPLGAVHEFLCEAPQNAAATAGFICGLIASLMNKHSTIIWISSEQTIFPPALLSYGIAPEKVIFIKLKKDKQILWTLDEALKCKGLAAVVGEMEALDFTQSRKLQLAVEQSGVTGFIMRRKESTVNTTASVTRWKIHSLPSHSLDGLPGVGHPAWHIDLQKVRNGKPSQWKIEWASGKFKPIKDVAPFIDERHEMKTGSYA